MIYDYTIYFWSLNSEIISYHISKKLNDRTGHFQFVEFWVAGGNKGRAQEDFNNL